MSWLMGTSRGWCSLEWNMQCTRYAVLMHYFSLYALAVRAFIVFCQKELWDCCGITQLLSRWGCELQIAHHKLVVNELMIHHMVDETVPYVIKSDLDMFGSVEGAGLGWSFLKLQHIGSSLQAVPLTMLPHYWSCAQQVQQHFFFLGMHMLVPCKWSGGCFATCKDVLACEKSCSSKCHHSHLCSLCRWSRACTWLECCTGMSSQGTC